MTRKLIVLSLALAAAFAASLPTSANALRCGLTFHVVTCGDVQFCCPNGMTCDC